MDEITEFKMKFNRSLEPIKVMLINRKEKLGQEDWLRFVELTKSSVIQNPDQYLGRELPQHEILTMIVQGIFDDFLRHVN